ncbi:MAG: substrate-binding domain-containing protein [Planctomycetota bacterium]
MSNATREVCLLIAGHSAGNVFQMPVLPDLLTGIERETERRNLKLIVATADEDRLPRLLSQRPGQAILFLGAGAAPSTARAIAEQLANHHGVWLMRDTHGWDLPFDRVFYDNAEVGRLAARHLADRGHGRVAMLDPQPGHSAHAARREAFVETGRQRGLEVTICERPASETDLSGPDAGARSVVDAFLALPDRPTGVFVPRDRLTQGVVAAFEASGVRVARDVDLVSCDNNADSIESIGSPPPSIDLHLNEVGAAGVARLIDRLVSPDSPRQHAYVQPSLAVPPAWPAWRKGRPLD